MPKVFMSVISLQRVLHPLEWMHTIVSHFCNNTYIMQSESSNQNVSKTIILHDNAISHSADSAVIILWH